MSLKGMAGVKKIKREMASNRETMDAKYTPNFSLKEEDCKDGKAATILFNGDPEDEPFIVKEHSVKQGANYFTVICAKGVKGHDGCVACAQSRKTKSVGLPSAKAVFNIFDTRMIHKIKNEEKTSAAGGNDRFDYFPCTAEDGVCKRCKRNEAIRAGQKKWTMSLTWASALDAINDRLNRKCLSCGGKTKVTGYLDTHDGSTVAEPEDGREEEFEKIMKCTKCKDCVPRSIFNTAIDVTRSGSNTSTSYQFSPNFDFTEEIESKPINLEAACAPDSADRQADRLGVPNPFEERGGRGKGEADDYDSEDDEDDGEELFNSKKKSSKDEDEDEDEDD